MTNAEQGRLRAAVRNASIEAAGFRRAAMATILVQAAAAGLGALGVIVIARLLGAEAQGTFAASIAMALVAGSLTSAGAVHAVLRVRGIRSQVVPAPKLFIFGTAAGLLSCLFVATSYFTSLAPYRGSIPSFLAVLAVAFLIPVDQVSGGLLRSEGAVVGAGVIDALESLSVLAIVGLLSLAGRLSVSTAIGAYACGLALSTVAHVLTWRLLPRRDIEQRRGNATSLSFRSLGQVWLAYALLIAVLRLDVFLVEAVVGERPAGEYSIAARLAEVILLGPMAVSGVVSARASRGVDEDLNRTTPLVVGRVVIISSSSWFAIAALAPPVLRWVLGPTYDINFPLLATVCGGRVLLGMGSIVADELVQRGRPGWPAVSSVAAALVFTAASFLLVPSLGGLGVGLGTLAAWAAYTAVAWRAFWLTANRWPVAFRT